jgi:hypothetical protein
MFKEGVEMLLAVIPLQPCSGCDLVFYVFSLGIHFLLTIFGLTKSVTGGSKAAALGWVSRRGTLVRVGGMPDLGMSPRMSPFASLHLMIQNVPPYFPEFGRFLTY